MHAKYELLSSVMYEYYSKFQLPPFPCMLFLKVSTNKQICMHTAWGPYAPAGFEEKPTGMQLHLVIHLLLYCSNLPLHL